MLVYALLANLVACAPMHHLPGPIGTLGRDTPPVARRAPEPTAPRHAPRRAGRRDGDAIARAAAELVGVSRLSVEGRTYRWDCSGFVSAAYARAGRLLTGSSADLFAAARDAHVLHRRRVPYVGDVAFFDDTYDRNGNGRRDDPLSHVAIVERVGADGTIGLVHLGSRGVVRLVMNLAEPGTARREDGTPINDVLRKVGAGDGPGARHLTGELWAGFGSLWRLDDDPPYAGGVASRVTR
jgi:hypothetical protein